MKVGSLCTGVGGLERGLGQVLPVELAWVAEIDPAACAVLDHHHPGVPNLGDLKAIKWAAAADSDLSGLEGAQPAQRRLLPPGGDRIDTITAGYPCQPFSQAGRRLGHEDPRHLWPWIADAVRHLRPGLVVLENVRGHVRRGLGTVVEDLADLGYVSRWGCVQAAHAGAPHRRERVFIVAHLADTDPGRWDRRTGDLTEAGRRDEPSHRRSLGVYEPAIRRWEQLTRPAPDPLDERGRLNHWFVEWMMGFPEGYVCGTVRPDIDPRPFHISRKDALRLLGNAVVPQQAALALSLLL